jgi:hypothetical protein
MLFSLFWFQFVLGGLVPESMHGVERIAVGILYMVLGLWQVIGNRVEVPRMFHDGFRASYAELGKTTPGGPDAA